MTLPLVLQLQSLEWLGWCTVGGWLGLLHTMRVPGIGLHGNHSTAVSPVILLTCVKLHVWAQFRGCIAFSHHLRWMQVEKAPTIIKTGVSKADAEELKKKLEAGAPPRAGAELCQKGSLPLPVVALLTSLVCMLCITWKHCHAVCIAVHARRLKVCSCAQ